MGSWSTVPRYASRDSSRLAAASNVCDTNDQKCGYAVGDGPCTVGAMSNAAVVCRTGTCSANALVCIPENATGVGAGDDVDVLLMSDLCG